VSKGLPISVIIVFPDGTDWFKANWVFRQLAQDVTDCYSGDAEVCKAVEVAEALGALDLKKMNDGLRRRVMEALKTVRVGRSPSSDGAFDGVRRPETSRLHSLTPASQFSMRDMAWFRQLSSI
jgi:hypothetical protein